MRVNTNTMTYTTANLFLVKPPVFQITQAWCLDLFENTDTTDFYCSDMIMVFQYLGLNFPLL